MKRVGGGAPGTERIAGRGPSEAVRAEERGLDEGEGGPPRAAPAAKRAQKRTIDDGPGAPASSGGPGALDDGAPLAAGLERTVGAPAARGPRSGGERAESPRRSRQAQAQSEPKASEGRQVDLLRRHPAGLAETVVRSASVAGHPGVERPLLLNAQNQRLVRAIAAWEGALAAQGIQARFFLGAGDLRRALLHMPADGPGDVELFIHVENHPISPPTLKGALAFLAAAGLDVEAELHRIYGEEKKLDIFFKDQVGLERGGPYRGELGAFEGMGDTSINALLYSPTLGRIEGSPADLERLAAGKIAFTEGEKAAPLEAPRAITGTRAKTEWPSTILRLALRSIRLAVDVQLSANPSKLVLDESFKDVLRGFELYFAKAEPEEVAKYALDEKYLEQLVKIFRNRTPKELDRVRRILEEQFPETVRLLGQLGVDLGVLWRLGVEEARDKRELRAIVRNARFDAIRPFVRFGGMTVTNPFVEPRELARLTGAVSLKGIPPEQMRMPSPAVLARYSSKLACRVAYFDELPFEVKRDTIEKVQAAIKMFAGPAGKRLHDEVSFAQRHFASFADLDAAAVGPKDARPLLAVLEEAVAGRPERPARVVRAGAVAEVHAALLASIDAGIDAAVAAGKRPVVFVDLDGTLYSMTSRILALLQGYDRERGTRHFEGLSVEDLPTERFEELLYAHLRRRAESADPDARRDLAGYAGISRVVEDVRRHVQDHLASREMMLQDQLNPALAERLRAWEAKGADVISLTARFPWQRPATEEALVRDGLPRAALFVGGSPGSTAASKLAAVRAHLAEHPDAVAVGFLDNDTANVAKMREQEGIVSAQVFWMGGERPDFVLTRGEPQDVYRVLSPRGG